MIAAGWLVHAASVSNGRAVLVSVLAYAAGLLAMLCCSTAYHFASASPRRELLRRLDHAAIFLMIAGTYTPFTVNRLPLAWSIAMTATIWSIALAGVAMKLARGRRFERFSVGIYLALGWIGLVAGKQLYAALDKETLVLLGTGGLLYSVGTAFHLWERLRFQSAIWHVFVLSAAACHYAAVLHGVVLR